MNEKKTSRHKTVVHVYSYEGVRMRYGTNRE